MLSVNAYDGQGATFASITYLWTTSSQRGNRLYGKLVMADSLEGELVFWIVSAGSKLAVVHFCG